MKRHQRKYRRRRRTRQTGGFPAIGALLSFIPKLAARVLPKLATKALPKLLPKIASKVAGAVATGGLTHGAELGIGSILKKIRGRGRPKQYKKQSKSAPMSPQMLTWVKTKGGTVKPSGIYSPKSSKSRILAPSVFLKDQVSDRLLEQKLARRELVASS